MLKSIVVHVTQKHIDAGQPWKRAFCPIAIALKEAVDRIEGVNPQRTGYGVSPMTKKVARWARSYDEGRFVKPDTFRLSLVHQAGMLFLGTDRTWD